MTTPQHGQLRIDTKYHWLAFMFAAFKPRALINGHQVGLQWGENVLPAPLGRHVIELWIPYLWKFGKASITVDNTYSVSTVFYAAPLMNFMKGAIGVEPQKFPGLVAAFVINIGIILGGVLCCGGALLLDGLN